MLVRSGTDMRIFLIVMGVLAGCGETSGNDAPGSGGAATVGGSSSSGGAAAQGGSSGSAVTPTDCGPTLTFHMQGGGPPDTQYCVGRPNGCDNQWLTILDTGGQVLGTFANCTATPCSTCESVGCPAICPQSSPLTGEGVETNWAGFVRAAGYTCGNNVSCERTVCAAAGDYVARFCGYLLSDEGSAGAGQTFDTCGSFAASEPTCVDVGFHYPSTETVIGVLDPTR